MKIQFLNGGLANQAFQYIFARYYELAHPGEVMYMDDSYFALNMVHNGYELDKVFGIKAHMLSECFDEEVWSYILEERRKGKSIPQILCENEIEVSMISEVGEGYKTFNPFDGKVISIPCNAYLPEIQDIQQDIYYHGYWINKHWYQRFQSIFLSEFQFPEFTDKRNKEYQEKIRTSQSVSLHIRRGDYVSLGWAFRAEDYSLLVKQFLIKQSAEWDVFVFSDDISWCKENQKQIGLDCFRSICFVEGNEKGKNYMDMQLMSQCKAMILSNSAFCYLAALLNTKKQYVLNAISNREI